MAESGCKIVSNNVNLQVENKPVECSESAEENKTETAMEPMLLEDWSEDKVPRSLRNMLNYFKNENITIDKSDTTVIFIYILMLETGFVTPDFALSSEAEVSCNFHYKRLLSLTESMPKGWRKTNGTYTLSFILAPHPHYVCTITCICVADDLVVNCNVRCASEVKQTLSVLFDPSMYVVNPTRLFQNLREFSRKFKTAISNPCKMLILEDVCERPAGLSYLPPEIFGYIRKYCDKQSVLNLDKSC